MMSLLNIPAHTNCKNCGECCGLIPATKKELEIIKEFVLENPDIKAKLSAKNKKNRIHCPFRDNGNKKCLIYPVRPFVCKIYGVSTGLSCKYGNSANIDFHNIMVKTKDDVEFLNDIF